MSADNNQEVEIQRHRFLDNKEQLDSKEGYVAKNPEDLIVFRQLKYKSFLRSTKLITHLLGVRETSRTLIWLMRRPMMLNLRRPAMTWLTITQLVSPKSSN